MKKLFILFFAVAFGLNAYSQNFGQQMGQMMGDAIVLKTLINNPNLQSYDMKNFMAFVKAGSECNNKGKYGDAMSHFTEASKIINQTRDQNLRKLYYNYGWREELEKCYNHAYTQYKLANPSLPQTSTSNSYSNGGYSSGSGGSYSGGSVGTYSGGTVNNNSSGNNSNSSKSYQKTAHPRKCGACSGSGKCGTCNGKGTYNQMSSGVKTCPSCGGRGTCGACNGSGTNGVTYY